MAIEDKRKSILPVSPRGNWDEAFKQMEANGDDALLIDDQELTHSWDEEKWEWSSNCLSIPSFCHQDGFVKCSRSRRAIPEE